MIQQPEKSTNILVRVMYDDRGCRPLHQRHVVPGPLKRLDM
jgi:hypothetical protein